MTVALSTSRLHLLLAFVSALTGTWWGVTAAAVVLAVLVARVAARRRVSRWSSTTTAVSPAGPAVGASGPFPGVAWLRQPGEHATGL